MYLYHVKFDYCDTDSSHKGVEMLLIRDKEYNGENLAGRVMDYVGCKLKLGEVIINPNVNIISILLVLTDNLSPISSDFPLLNEESIEEYNRANFKNAKQPALKPCPFCGGGAFIKNSIPTAMCVVECSGCSVKITDVRKEFAIDAWNKRV